MRRSPGGGDGAGVSSALEPFVLAGDGVFDELPLLVGGVGSGDVGVVGVPPAVFAAEQVIDEPGDAFLRGVGVDGFGGFWCVGAQLCDGFDALSGGFEFVCVGFGGADLVDRLECGF